MEQEADAVRRSMALDAEDWGWRLVAALAAASGILVARQGMGDATGLSMGQFAAGSLALAAGIITATRSPIRQLARLAWDDSQQAYRWSLAICFTLIWAVALLSAILIDGWLILDAIT